MVRARRRDHSRLHPERTITLRDAIHTGMTFDIFNRHADKIAMANVAQSVNCIHSLFLAPGGQIRTHPVLSRVRHVSATWARGRCRCGIRNGPTVPAPDGQARIAAIAGSASIREKRLTVTLTNPSVDSPVPPASKSRADCRPAPDAAWRLRTAICAPGILFKTPTKSGLVTAGQHR